MASKHPPGDNDDNDNEFHGSSHMSDSLPFSILAPSGSQLEEELKYQSIKGNKMRIDAFKYLPFEVHVAPEFIEVYFSKMDKKLAYEYAASVNFGTKFSSMLADIGFDIASSGTHSEFGTLNERAKIKYDRSHFFYQEPYSELMGWDKNRITKKSMMDLLLIAALTGSRESVKDGSVRYIGPKPVYQPFGLFNQGSAGKMLDGKGDDPVGLIEYAIRNNPAFRGITEEDLKQHFTQALSADNVVRIKEAFNHLHHYHYVTVYRGKLDPQSASQKFNQFHQNLEKLQGRYVGAETSKSSETIALGYAGPAAQSSVELQFYVHEASDALKAANVMTQLFFAKSHPTLEINASSGNRPVVSYGEKIERFENMNEVEQKEILKELKKDPDLLVNLYKNMINGSAAGMYGRGFDSLVVSQNTNGEYIQIPALIGVHNVTPSGKSKNPREGLFGGALSPKDIKDFVGAKGKFDFMSNEDRLRIKDMYSDPTPQQKQQLNAFIQNELTEISGKLNEAINSAYPNSSEDHRQKILQDVKMRITSVQKLTPKDIEEIFAPEKTAVKT